MPENVNLSTVRTAERDGRIIVATVFGFLPFRFRLDILGSAGDERGVTLLAYGLLGLLANKAATVALIEHIPATHVVGIGLETERPQMRMLRLYLLNLRRMSKYLPRQLCHGIQVALDFVQFRTHLVVLRL